ncbi:TPA: hypothetical protein L8O79_002371 [Klebsiella pneumoniae]|nr:hypothetical protein [Klebsiella pneumoniae]
MLLIKPASHARYDLDKSVCRYRSSPVHPGAKPNPPTTPHFAEKKFLHQKPEKMGIAQL